MRAIPEDARLVMALMLSQPIVLMIHLLIPDDVISRIAFSVVLGILTVCLGLIAQRRRDALGFAVLIFGICGSMMSVAILASIAIVDGAKEIAVSYWRAISIAQQLWLVVGWFALSIKPVPWLSRCCARSAAIASTGSLLWFCWNTFAAKGHLVSSIGGEEAIVQGLSAVFLTVCVAVLARRWWLRSIGRDDAIYQAWVRWISSLRTIAYRRRNG